MLVDLLSTQTVQIYKKMHHQAVGQRENNAHQRSPNTFSCRNFYGYLTPNTRYLNLSPSHWKIPEIIYWQVKKIRPSQALDHNKHMTLTCRNCTLNDTRNGIVDLSRSSQTLREAQLAPLAAPFFFPIGSLLHQNFPGSWIVSNLQEKENIFGKREEELGKVTSTSLYSLCSHFLWIKEFS